MHRKSTVGTVRVRMTEPEAYLVYMQHVPLCASGCNTVGDLCEAGKRLYAGWRRAADAQNGGTQPIRHKRKRREAAPA